MGFGDSIKKWFSSESESDKSQHIDDLVTFRKEKIDLLKSEISDLVDKFDSLEDSYSNMEETTKGSIKKGFSGGEGILSRIETRYKKNRESLLKSLSQKKDELRIQESKLDDLLEKADKPQSYADSIVCDCDGNILMLLRRTSSSFEPNKWGLPGGKIEENEDHKDAAIRELKEETNLTAKSCDKLGVVTLDDGGMICYYRVEVEEHRSQVALDDEEHGNYCYMSLDEIKSRGDEDFVMNSKCNLLKIIDPFYDDYVVVTNGYKEGKLDEETYNKVTQAYNNSIKV